MRRELTPFFSKIRPNDFLHKKIMQFPLENHNKIGYNISNEIKAGFNMLKKILIFVLIAAMLSLSSCRIVEVIDHDLFVREETEVPKKEYDPWGYWHSYQACLAIEFKQDSSTATLYYLTTGYYEYYEVVTVACTYDGNSTFVLTLDSGKTLNVNFDKFNNAVTLENQIYTREDKAPQEHATYTFPNYIELDPSSYITIDDIDFTHIAQLVFEGAPYKIATTYYGSLKKIPVFETISRAAQKGDVVNIDYVGTVDGVAFDRGSATGVNVFISEFDNNYIPGFIDGIIGHTVGETFDVPVTFPQNYGSADLAGKDAIFTMTLNGICDMTLTDEQVTAYESNSYTTYEKWLLDQEFAITNELFADALTEAASNIKPLSANTYLYYYQQAMDYYHLVAYYYSIDFSLLMSYYGLSETTIMRESLKQATYDMALFVLLEQKGLDWTDEEFAEKHDALVAEYLEANEGATNEEAIAYADSMKPQLELELAEEKALAWAFEFIFPSEQE